MASIDYISEVVDDLVRKYDTRDPYRICKELDVKIRLKDLGKNIKAYYLYQSRVRSIVVNNRISEPMRRILVAHELGHDRLHKEIAMLKGFRETVFFSITQPIEYEANLFAAELLIDDDELTELIDYDEKCFFGIARELYVPAALLDFKYRILRHKGHQVEIPYIANGDFLKYDIEGCFDEEDVY